MEPSAGQLTGDAGLLPVRQLGRRIGLMETCTAVFDETCAPDPGERAFLETVGSRIDSTLAGYEDQNNHEPCTPTPSSNGSRSAHRTLTTEPG